MRADLTKPEVGTEFDTEIIEYYEQKYGIDDFTADEKHDILQHERRARMEKQKNPEYKTYLCYSIIKRLNTVKPGATTTTAASTAAPTAGRTTQETVKEEVKEETNKNNSNNNNNNKEKVLTKREIVVDSTDVLSYASKFPRRHLGSLVYTPFPTLSSYRQLSLFSGLDVKHDTKVPLLPELREHINSIVTVRIPAWYVDDLRNNPHYLRRELWGSDVYTDDSDVLLMLKHNGFLPALDEQIEGNDAPMDKQTPGNTSNAHNVQQTTHNYAHFMNILGGDIHVDLLVLPPLRAYQGCFRNGINSRAWRAHDGMSVAVFGVRYGEKGSAV